MTKISIRFFNDREVRAIWDEVNSKWWFSAIDIVRAINKEDDYVKAGNYWRWLKKKLNADGIELVSVTHGLNALCCKFLLQPTPIVTCFHIVGFIVDSANYICSRVVPSAIIVAPYRTNLLIIIKPNRYLVHCLVFINLRDVSHTLKRHGAVDGGNGGRVEGSVVGRLNGWGVAIDARTHNLSFVGRKGTVE